MARYGFFNPDASLQAAVEEAASGELSDELRESLGDLGGRIFGRFLRQLRTRNVGNPYSEAQDLFQYFCARVISWIRRNGAAVTASWFWTVATNVYINHVQRELVKKRDAEQPIDWDAGVAEWLLPRLDGSTAIGRIDPWVEAQCKDLMLRCIAKLTRRQQEYLHYDLTQRLSGPELDAALGLGRNSRAALKAKVLRALRKALFEELGQQDPMAPPDEPGKDEP